MGLFDKIIGKKNSDGNVNQDSDEKVIKSVFDTEYPIDRSNGYQVFSASLGPAIVVQEACAEIVVKGRNWNADFAKGTLSFGSDVYPMQLIGSESNQSNTWLWGWENINGFDEKIIKFANETKEKTKDWNLQAFTLPQFDLSEVYNGHNMSIIACGISENNYCYYKGPHSGGAVFMAFSGVPDEVFASVDIQKFSSTVLKCIQSHAVDHKIFVESFLIWNKTEYEWVGDRIIAHFNEDLQIEFESVGDIYRVKSLNAVLANS